MDRPAIWPKVGRPRWITEGLCAASSWLSFSSVPAKADLQALDLSEPAFTLSFGDPIEQVVADLDQAVSLGRLGPEERTSQASLSELSEHEEGLGFQAAPTTERSGGQVGPGPAGRVASQGGPPLLLGLRPCETWQPGSRGGRADMAQRSLE